MVSSSSLRQALDARKQIGSTIAIGRVRATSPNGPAFVALLRCSEDRCKKALDLMEELLWSEHDWLVLSSPMRARCLLVKYVGNGRSG